MAIDLAQFATLLPIDKPVSKTDFIYKVKSSVRGSNTKLVTWLYLLQFHCITRDHSGKVTIQ